MTDFLSPVGRQSKNRLHCDVSFYLKKKADRLCSPTEKRADNRCLTLSAGSNTCFEFKRLCWSETVRDRPETVRMHSKRPPFFDGQEVLLDGDRKAKSGANFN